jgi:hypothetical protein
MSIFIFPPTPPTLPLSHISSLPHINYLGKIFAFSGKIGSGKNYLAENPVFDYFRSKNKNVLILAFADYLKVTCNVKDRIIYERLFIDKDVESRKCLQTRGTLERKDNELIYIEAMECYIRLAFDRKIDIVIISDLRYKNEFIFLKHIGATTFRINAPQRTKSKLLKECNNDEKVATIIASHSSEIDLDNYPYFNYYLNNDYSNEDNIVNEIKTILSNIQ